MKNDKASKEKFDFYLYTYCLAGNVVSIVDPNGTSTDFTYDALNRVTMDERRGTIGIKTKYAYDQNGNLIKLEKQADETGTVAG